MPPEVATAASVSYVLSLNGVRYDLPAALPPVPPNGFIVVYLGVTGTDDLDFSDGVATLYASHIPTTTFQRGGYAGLYTSATLTTTTIADFVAWGTVPVSATEQAAEAGLWPDGAALEFDVGFGGEDTVFVPQRPNESFGRYAGEWASYRAAHSSRGRRNPPPVPMHTTTPDGSVIDAQSFGLAWTPVPGATAYEFQIDITTMFSNPLVSIVTPHAGWKPAQPGPATYCRRARHPANKACEEPTSARFKRRVSTWREPFNFKPCWTSRNIGCNARTRPCSILAGARVTNRAKAHPVIPPTRAIVGTDHT
jgi:hypothetical protein